MIHRAVWLVGVMTLVMVFRHFKTAFIKTDGVLFDKLVDLSARKLPKHLLLADILSAE